MELLIYLLKSGGLIAVFYLAYHFLVRKETFFTMNRWFLLSGLLTSLLLPFYFIKKTIVIERPQIPISDFVPAVQNPIPAIQEIPAVEAFDWTQLIWIGYAIIASVLVIKIVLNLISLYRMLHQQQVIKKEQFKLVNLNKNIAPFSFFNYIVYNQDLYSNDELQSILLHEQIHSQQKHSADVLIAELFCSVFWFNPFVWLYKKAITQNLEYIADQKAIEQLEDKKSYQHALLKVVSNQNCLPITNNFYQSLIKKRIVMLNKNQSHKRSTLKYTMIIPALIGFVLLFQIKVEAKVKITPAKATVFNSVHPESISTQNAEVTTVISNDNEQTVETLFVDKISSDLELKEDAEHLKKVFDIDYKVGYIKRNEKGEIVAIKLSFDDNRGNQGKTQQNRTIPIRPIFFKISKSADGKNIIGFYDNSDMIKKPLDAVNENKITTIESIPDDALIYVDTERYTKEDLNELDSKGLEKIDVVKDAESLQKYGAKDKGVVYLITTNWPSREQSSANQQTNSPNIITLQNGNEVVIYNRNNVKIPEYPSVVFTDKSPILILDGIQQKNPRFTLERMDISKIKTIKVLNESDKEVKGTPIYKMILTTK